MKKILIIEDDQVVANIYKNKFAIEGYDVQVALDGESGYRTITSFRPDVVILDLMLPQMSGLEVLAKIRMEHELKQLPVVVFSNTYLSNMVQQAWKAGATKCLSKATCSPKQVIEVVRGLGVASSPEEAKAKAEAAAQSGGKSAHGKSVTDPDVAMQAELRKSFVASFPTLLSGTRGHLQSITKTTNEADRIKHLDELYRFIHTLTGNAAVSGEEDIAQMADALEAFLKELCEKPKSINPSTLRTLALTIDFFGMLFDRASKHPGTPVLLKQPKASILVVDDEAISRRAVTYALEKAKLTSTAVEHPDAALKLLAENHFDLVFLDVDMPGMNGFEVCTKLRTFVRNKATPVVFVTGLTDFESRANSTMSGGNDLIAKPFLFMELAVKALVFILRGRLAKAATTQER